MKTAIIYESKHHNNTKKVCEKIAKECNIEIFEAKNAIKNFKWDEYNTIGFASGIAYKKFYKNVNKAAEMIPSGKKTFFIYTCAKINNTFTKEIQDTVEKKGCKYLGSYGCKGYNTYGPLKLIGGMNKKNPTEEELQKAVEFVKQII